MGIKRTNFRKLASLAAVGAGAVAVTADKAEAGTINYSGPINATIGWFGSSGHGLSTFHLVGTAAKFEMSPSTSNHAGSSGSHVWKKRVNAYGASGLHFGLGGGSLLVAGPGATWGAASGSAGGKLLVGGRRWSSIGGTTTSYGLFGKSPFTDQYLLFRTGAGNYGWVELSYAVTDAGGSSSSLGPAVTVEGYAYDTSGAIIAAGDTGAAVPEPSTLAETGLSALVLGAAAWRRRKGTRLG